MPTFHVQRNDRQLTVAAFLRAKLSLTWSEAKALVEADKVFVNGHRCRQIDHRMKPDMTVEVREPASTKPRAPTVAKPAFEKPQYHGPEPIIVYRDEEIVIVDKPAGLTTMRNYEEVQEFGKGKQKYLPATLADILPGLLGEPNKPLIAVHRIDRDTSGLVVFARNRNAATKLEADFKAHRLERRYLALTRGIPKEGRIESHLVRDRGDGRRGSGSADAEDAQLAVSHFRILREFHLHCLVECRLETGRTHQVRIHLGEAGAPLCGERIYDRPINGLPVEDDTGSPRQMLHATILGLTHPTTGESMRWESAMPEDMQSVFDTIASR